MACISIGFMSATGLGLKEWREKAGLSQERVADAAGVTAKTVDNWEKGSSAPRVDQALRMSKLAPGLLSRLGLLEVRK